MRNLIRSASTFRRNALFAAIALLMMISEGRAQNVPFLPELMGRISEFNRLYAEKQKTGADLSAIEPLRVRAETDFTKGNLPGIIESLGEGLAILQGKKWDAAAAFANSLALQTSATVVERNQSLSVSLARMYPADESKAFEGPATVTITVERAENAPPPSSEGPQFRNIVMSDKMAIGQAVTTIDDKIRAPDGAYQVVARVEADGRLIAVLRKPLYAVADFSGRIAGLSVKVAQIKGSTNPTVAQTAGLVSSAEYQLHVISLLNQQPAQSDINVLEELNSVESELGALMKGSDPFAAGRGELERAYRSASGQLIPYGVYVPKSYDGSRAFPLVIALHGALGDERSYLSGVYNPEIMKADLETHGYIMATPRGPGLIGQYAGPAEEDVMEVLSQVLKSYKIDPSRIYLTGHSMGGFGTWNVAWDHPDSFAAIAPVSGGSPAPPAQLPALLAKLKNVPALVVHGAKDGIVKPQMSRQIVDAAKKAGMNVTYIEVAGADHISVVAPTFNQILDFFDKNPKRTGS